MWKPKPSAQPNTRNSRWPIIHGPKWLSLITESTFSNWMASFICCLACRVHCADNQVEKCQQGNKEVLIRWHGNDRTMHCEVRPLFGCHLADSCQVSVKHPLAKSIRTLAQDPPLTKIIHLHLKSPWNYTPPPLNAPQAPKVHVK